MASKYWDPGTLFQIISFGDDNEIQCVGRATSRGGARCRWTVTADKRQRITSMLEQMARRQPSNVTDDELRSLARLCLCQDWHARQENDTALRWGAVTRQAAEHLNNACASSVEDFADGFIQEAREQGLVHDTSAIFGLPRLPLAKRWASRKLRVFIADHTQRTLKSKNEELSRLRQAQSENEKHQRESNEQVQNLEKKIQGMAQVQKSQGETEVREIRARYAEATNNAQRLQKSIEYQQAKLERVISVLNEKDRIIRDLSNDKVGLECALEKANEREQDLSLRVTRLENSIKEADEGHIKAIGSEKARLEEKIQQVKEREEGLRSEVTRTIEENGRMSMENCTNLNKLNDLERELNVARGRIRHFEMELSGTRNRIKELLEDQTATRKEAEQCRAQFENKRQLSLVRQMQISILSRRIAKLEAGISASEVHRTEFGPADSQRNVLETTLGCIHWLHQRGSWMKKPKNALVAWPSWLNWF